MQYTPTPPKLVLALLPLHDHGCWLAVVFFFLGGGGGGGGREGRGMGPLSTAFTETVQLFVEKRALLLNCP